MKNSKCYCLGLSALLLLVLSCANKNEKSVEQKTDPVEMSMENGRTLMFENDYATVLKVRLEPGESIKSHSAEKRVI